MLIVFTGHRDRLASPADLHNLEALYPCARWMHGGAKGFDTQAHTVGVELGKQALPPFVSDQLPQFTLPNANVVVTVRPTCGRYHPKQAPIIRNIAMVDFMRDGDVLVACYDGRKTGGTAQCVRYAREKGRTVIVLEPKESKGLTMNLTRRQFLQGMLATASTAMLPPIAFDIVATG